MLFRPRLERCLAILRFTVCGVLVLELAGSNLTLGHETDTEYSGPFQPSVYPDRIVLTWTRDPSTSQAVTWRTDTSASKPVGRIAIATDGPDFDDNPRTITGRTFSLRSDRGLALYHTVEFNRLLPETKYAYQVGDGDHWSEWSHFTTASKQPKPFTFVYFGDAQNDLKAHWSRVVREAYSDAPKASFMLHAGDLVNRANRDLEWGQWFYASSHIHRTIPAIATPGNHEYSDGLSNHWRPTFAFPTNGPRSLHESVYWIDYQGARIISLNSNERRREQVPWLKRVLATNEQAWTVITFHHPIYSSAKGRDNEELRALWQPIFDQYQVDIVLQGHDHTYARSELMEFQENLSTGVTRRSETAGTMYVVSVSGPKMYELGNRAFMRRRAANTQLYQIITIDGAELRYEARTAIGRLYDAFTLRKRPGQANELIDQIPDTPARLTR